MHKENPEAKSSFWDENKTETKRKKQLLGGQVLRKKYFQSTR